MFPPVPVIILIISLFSFFIKRYFENEITILIPSTSKGFEWRKLGGLAALFRGLWLWICNILYRMNVENLTVFGKNPFLIEWQAGGKNLLLKLFFLAKHLNFEVIFIFGARHNGHPFQKKKRKGFLLFSRKILLFSKR